MKTSRFVLLAGLGLSVAFGDVETRRAEALGKPMETFRTLEGRIYQDVVITKINSGGVSFKHSDGAARLRFDDLSPAQRKYFGIDERTAAKVYRKEAERRAAYELLVEKLATERRIAAEERAVAREKARQIAMEAAAAAKSEKVADQPAVTIPLYPTIQRVNTRPHRSRSYREYSPYYGGYYGHSTYSGYRPVYRSGVRFGNFSCSTPSIIIRK